MADESEEACLVNPKSPANGSMPYTDGLNKATVPSSVQSTVHTAPAPSASASSAQQAHSTTVHHTTHSNTANNSYDINDDIILSQFHADAIKQVGERHTIYIYISRALNIYAHTHLSAATSGHLQRYTDLPYYVHHIHAYGPRPHIHKLVYPIN